MPEEPYTPEPVDVIAYTYTDSYWDVTPNSQDTSYLTDENGNTLPAYGSATLNFYGSVTSDYNPWAQTQCQWNQNMMLLDLSIDQLIAMGSLSGWGSTSFARWDFWGGTESAIQLNVRVGIDNCGPTMPLLPPEGVGGIITDGISGTSHSRYLNVVSFIPNPVFYTYRHNTSHQRENCPARCALEIPQTLTYVSNQGYPGHELDLKLAFDKNGVCAAFKFQYDTRTVTCHNTYDWQY
jgi:hypothetical protein